LKICPNCNTEQPQDDVKSCYVCGYLFDDNAGFSSNTPSNDDSSDFVVREAHEDDREFVGEHNKPKTKEQDNDLEIETNSDIMEHEATNEIQNHSTPHESKQLEDDVVTQPIGKSSPPPPPLSEEIPTNNGIDDLTDNIDKRETSSPTKKIEKLSEEKIKQIEQNLYHSDNYLSDKEKKELISKIDNSNNSTDKPFDNTPIIPPKKEKSEKVTVTDSTSSLSEPKISKKSKGIAYFYKNYIQLMGRQELLINDELTVNKQIYLLKPKRIKPVFIYGPLALVFVIILFVIGSFFIANVNNGQGQVIGLVLNGNNQPYIEGATIRFTDLGKSVKSNPQGFFLLDDIPIGTQKIEYIVNGHIIRKDFVTITSNNTSMILLRPQKTNQLATLEKTSVAVQKPTVSTPIHQSSVQKKSSISPPPTPKKKKTAKQTTYKKSRRSKYAKITLAANIDGARFKLDGSVLGAGNLTYSKIKTGTHNYYVSSDGYQSVKGKIKLSPGENKKLVVTLKPLNNAQKEKSYKADYFYFSGKAALENSDYKTAVSDLTAAIKKQPNSATAYFYRGKAYMGLKNNKMALDDFLQAADIYQFKKEYNKAITCYNQAIEIDSKSTTAYLGRGNAFLNKGEELAALTDFDKVTRLDKRNFQAYFGLGKVRFQTEQYKRAIKNFKDARSIDHNNPYVLQYLMLSYLAVDDYKNMKKSFNKFKSIASDKQMKTFKNNSKYSAVLKIINK